MSQPFKKESSRSAGKLLTLNRGKSLNFFFISKNNLLVPAEHLNCGSIQNRFSYEAPSKHYLLDLKMLWTIWH
jgi:hypothetical protein